MEILCPEERVYCEQFNLLLLKKEAKGMTNKAIQYFATKYNSYFCLEEDLNWCSGKLLLTAAVCRSASELNRTFKRKNIGGGLVGSSSTRLYSFCSLGKCRDMKFDLMWCEHFKISSLKFPLARFIRNPFLYFATSLRAFHSGQQTSLFQGPQNGQTIVSRLCVERKVDESRLTDVWFSI